MFCQKCGNELNEGALFCPKCGTKTNGDHSSNDGIDHNINANPVRSVQKRNTPRICSIVAIVLFLFSLLLPMTRYSWPQEYFDEYVGTTTRRVNFAPHLYNSAGIFSVLLIIVCLGLCIYLSDKSIKKFYIITIISVIVMFIVLGVAWYGTPDIIEENKINLGDDYEHWAAGFYFYMLSVISAIVSGVSRFVMEKKK